MDKSEFIVRVLLPHPTPAISENKEIIAAQASIKKRYREIRRSMPFSTAEIISKKEWLDDYFKTVL